MYFDFWQLRPAKNDINFEHFHLKEFPFQIFLPLIKRLELLLLEVQQHGNRHPNGDQAWSKVK
jgi:hypothetical protein